MPGQIHYGTGDSVGFGTTATSHSNTASFAKSDLSNIQVGDVLIAWIHCQSAAVGGTITAPAGWVRYGAAIGVPFMSASRLSGFYYYPIVTSADITSLAAAPTWTFSDATTRVACVVARATGIDLDAIEGVAPVRFDYAAPTTALTLSSLTTRSTKSLLVAGVHHQNSINTTAPNTTSLLTEFQEYKTDPTGSATSSAGNTGAAMGYADLTIVGPTGNMVAQFDESVAAAGGEMVAFNVLGGTVPPTVTPYIVGTTTTFTTGAASTTFTINKPTGYQDGDVLIMALSGQTPTATSDFICSGWSRIGLPFTPSSSGYRLLGFYALPIPSAAALTQTSFTFTNTDTASGGRICAEIMIVRGAELSDIVAGYSPAYALSNNTNPVVPELTTKVNNSLQLTLFGSQLVSGVAYTVSETPSSMTQQANLVTSTANVSKTTLYVYQQNIGIGPSGDKTIIWSEMQAQSSGVSVAIRALGEFDPDTNVGTTVGYTNAADSFALGRLFYTSATATLATPLEVRPVPKGYASVTEMLATPQFSVAHRGGSANWPEMSLHSYTQSVFWGMGALELSLARTSDGVWFGLHDASLDRTSGTTGFTASAHTWAEVQAYQITAAGTTDSGQPKRPYMRWEELMKAYYGTHVIFVDPKNAGNFGVELLDMMDSLPGTPTDHFVTKSFGPSSASSIWIAQPKLRGYKSWGYFYQADVPNLPLYAAQYDILGMDYTANQASWDAIKTYSKPIIGHITPSSAAATMAYTKGADGLMVSGVRATIPRKP